MAKLPTPAPVIAHPFPSSHPVARTQGGMVKPVAPQPGPFTRMKAGLPNLPSATQLFHTPRKAGQGNPSY